MIQSMTGYGKCVAEYNGKKIHAEIKSLNSKALDLSTRLAPLYREKEMEVRQLISTALERGKVDFNLWIEKDEVASVSTINKELVGEYYNQIKDVSASLGLDMSGVQSTNEWMKVLLRMPDVMSRSEMEELAEEEWVVARQVVEGAINALVEFRKQEGDCNEHENTCGR